MCTVNNIVVDEMELRELLPELDSNAAIQLWIQKLVDLHIQQMRDMPNHDKTQEDLWRAIEQDPELLLKPSEIVDDGGEAIDLETAREMLHETVHDVYAMPDRDMTPEELYNAISDEIDYIYNKT